MSNHSTTQPVVKRRKKSLIITMSTGLIALALLTLFVVGITNQIADDSASVGQTARSSGSRVVGNEDAFTLPDNTSNIPNTLDAATLVDVVAKNQPAVVRILTVYCSDVTLSSGGATMTQKDACSGGVGSGSIISRDGYIATNGHVVATSPKQALLSSLSSTDEVTRYLDYLVATELLTRPVANNISEGVQNDTASANQALDDTVALIPSSTIASRNIDLYYAVQLGNEPVRIDRSDNRLKVDFTDTIVRAQLIDKDYDQEAADDSLQSGQFTSSDIALLKVNGEFPYVRLSKTGSVAVGDQLTAIGFPAFIDDSVNTDQWQTIPTITQGQVADITRDAAVGGRKIINTSVPIAQGESGGPAFNNAGEQIGLNTYTALNCKDLKCFGDGQVRDVADLWALLDKNNISLKSGGITEDWYRALDAYASGNYAEALTAFAKVQQEYPPNYLASPLAQLAREQAGGDSDTSPSSAQTVTTVILIGVGCFVLIVITTIIIVVVYFKRQQRRDSTTVGPPPQPPTP